MELETCYRLAPDAALRLEPFGGLVYRYDNRRLYFLYSRDLVDFVRSLDGTRSLGPALDAFLAARALPETTRQQYLQALGQLAKLQILCPAAHEASKG